MMNPRPQIMLMIKTDTIDIGWFKNCKDIHVEWLAGNEGPGTLDKGTLLYDQCCR